MRSWLDISETPPRLPNAAFDRRRGRRIRSRFLLEEPVVDLRRRVSPVAWGFVYDALDGPRRNREGYATGDR
jgi:hypothetical protein